ncbi:MAG: hypothetical protein GC160_30020 [Acidobacteria bacterium]|nr:hypothetical protein [Acidobacteriota bacterium]
MKTARNLLIAFVLGALVTAAPLYLQLRDAQQQAAAQAERLQAELGMARSRLAISSIHSRLGLLAAAVRSGDFAAAKTLSGPLYDDAAQAAESSEDADDQRRLKTLVETRDAVTAALATEDASILPRLEQLFQLLAASL